MIAPKNIWNFSKNEWMNEFVLQSAIQLSIKLEIWVEDAAYWDTFSNIAILDIVG